MGRDELQLWLRLTLSPGVGNEAARKLLAAFGPPDRIFSQSATALKQVVSTEQAQVLQTVPAGLAALTETTWKWLNVQEPGEPASAVADGVWRHMVALDDADYPVGLLHMADPPLLLYMMGCGAWATPVNSESNDAIAPVIATELASNLVAFSLRNSVAVVGSRNPTPQGLTHARQFSQELAQAGVVIVSGMALGVDGAAHEGAIAGWQQARQAGAGQPDTARLATIAVVGTGLDRVYPKAHLTLARDIARCGLIVSEYPLGTPPLPQNFPKRNRIIAGLTQGTLVVEAAYKSGSLITARLASEQGKEVFAIPGSIHSITAKGCHALIREGAKLVESALDVLEDLRLESAHNKGSSSDAANSALQASTSTKPASRARPKQKDVIPDLVAIDQAHTGAISPFDNQNDLLEALGYDPVSLDALQARTGLDTPHLQAQLMALELDGHVARLPGGLFQRMARA